MADIQHHQTGERITAITFEEYWEHYAQQHYEWVGEGMVKLPPIFDRHELVRDFLRFILAAYFGLRPIGTYRGEPFAMRFDLDGQRRVRLPDLQIILHPTPDRLTSTATIGPADIVIEITSLGTSHIDYSEKFDEYQTIGVQEYWIIDLQDQRATFHRIDDGGQYQQIATDDTGNYTTPLLPDLAIHVPTLWQNPLPDIFAVGDMIRRQLGAG